MSISPFSTAGTAPTGRPHPDLLIWSIDGVDIAGLTAANASGSVNFFAGGTLLQSGNVWDGGGYSDKIVDMSTSTLATFAHTGSTLTFGLRFGGAGFQGGSDESWGFDNLSIAINRATIPEPASWALMIGGFALVGAAMRRRRTAPA